MKRCKKCGLTLPVDSFYAESRNKDLKFGSCKSCCAKNRLKSYYNCIRQDPDYNKKISVKKRYRLEWDDYQDRLKTGCSACGSFYKLCIDHDHSCCPGEFTCGKCIRGVLCSPCNRTLGYARESINTLRNLANYLEGERH